MILNGRGPAVDGRVGDAVPWGDSRSRLPEAFSDLEGRVRFNLLPQFAISAKDACNDDNGRVISHLGPVPVQRDRLD